MADGPSVFIKDGVIFVRASAYGSCTRKLWAFYENIQPIDHSDATKRVFKEGHLHEAAATEQLTMEGYHLYGDQDEVIIEILPNRLHIIGHIDGFIGYGSSSQFDEKEYGDDRLWECKSASRTSFDVWVKDRFEGKQGYAWQLAIYMHGSGKDSAHFTTKRRDDGLIDTMLVDKPPKTLREIRSRAVKIYKAFKSGEMPDCEDDGYRWSCEFWFLHDEDVIDDPELEIDADNIPELDDLLGMYHEVNETEKWAKAEKKRLKAKIQSEFRKGRDQFGTDHFTVKVTQIHTSKIDKAKLIAGEGQEVVDKYSKPSDYERWDISSRSS